MDAMGLPTQMLLYLIVMKLPPGFMDVTHHIFLSGLRVRVGNLIISVCLSDNYKEFYFRIGIAVMIRVVMQF